MDPATGGPCEGIRNSIPELKKLGIRNEVVCLDEPSSVFLNKDSFVTHALEKGKGPWRYSRMLVPWLLKNLHRFDVVIVHGLWLYPSFALTRAIRIFKKQQAKNKHTSYITPKVYIMPHGMLDPYFQTDPQRKMKAFRNRIYWKLIENKVINEAAGMLFTCEEELKLAREPFRPYQPNKELNVGYGVKTPPDFCSKMKKAFLKLCPEIGDDPYYLFLGRIHEKKGVNLLIEAYSKQLKKNISSGTCFPKLVVAGPGLESAYGVKMQSLVKETLHLEDHIKFPGLLLNDSKWGAFYGCEAFILPSHQENFGIVVAEALACYKPVFISDKVNIWKEIKNSGAGIVKENTVEGVQQFFEFWESMSIADREEMKQSAKYAFEKNFKASTAAHRLLQAVKSY